MTRNKQPSRYISVLLSPEVKAKLKEMARDLEREHQGRFNVGSVAAKIITKHVKGEHVEP